MFAKLITTFALLTTLLIGTLSPAVASAASPFSASKQEACNGATLGGTGGCDTDTESGKVNSLVSKIIGIISVIVGIAAVIMIIIYGLRFVTSGGDSNAVSAARNGLIYALVGLAIAASAQFIVKFVLNKI